MVLPASCRVVVSITLSRLCVLTLKRNGPFGDAPVLGTNANLPRMRDVVELVRIGARSRS